MIWTVSSLPLTGLSTLGSGPARSRRNRQPATGPPGSYPDRTHTGRRRRAYEQQDPLLRHSVTSCSAGRTKGRGEAPLVTASTPRTPQTRARGLLRCGLVAGPVFATAFLLQGAVRDGCRPPRHPVSSLALGPRGWIQAANFAVTGTLFLAGATGLSRVGDPATISPAVPALIGAAGAGLIGAAVFPTDPVSGYPPGTLDALPSPSRAGAAHNLAAIPVFLGLPAAALAIGWRSWRSGRRGSGSTT
jgi:Protein of unknown function (DUF998)